MTCRSDIALTLMTVVTDESGGVNETSMTHTFTETDGVDAAMEYRCDVTLSVNKLNMTSGSSPPAFGTTLTLNGRTIYRTIMVGPNTGSYNKSIYRTIIMINQYENN